MTMPLITIEGLSVGFPGHQAVKNLDLAIARGETLALVGESGCGKSTTALALMRLLPRQAKVSGRILLDGQDLLALDERSMCAVRGNRLSMIFQEPMTCLNPVLTLGTQIGETLRLHRGLSGASLRRRVIELLDLVKVPDPHRRIDDYPHHLSGGQRQRVMIAAAIACEPDLLIADEPTTALDVTIQAQILALLDTLRRELSMGLLLITHDLGVVGQWADRVAVMWGGERVEEARTEKLLTHPDHPYTRGLLGASLRLDESLHYTRKRLPEIRNRLDAATQQTVFELVTPAIASRTSTSVAGVKHIAHAQQRSASTATAGEHTALHPPKRPPLLEVIDLQTQYLSRYGTINAVDGVTFQIGHGETLGLVGESGCGKSTLSRTILRLLEPSSGQIRLNGQDTRDLDRRGLVHYRSQVQMIFQDPYASLNPRHTVEHILDAALTIHKVGNRVVRQNKIRQILDAVGLPREALKRYPDAFSGGQRQRIGIARALVLRPALVICDEPVSALDVSVQAQILNLLTDLKSEFNLSYLFISHDLSVVHYLADRVMVMNGGRIVETGDHNTLWRSPRHAYTRTLIDALPRHRSEALRRIA